MYTHALKPAALELGFTYQANHEGVIVGCFPEA